MSEMSERKGFGVGVGALLAALGLSVLGARALGAASAGGPPLAAPTALSSVDQLRARFNDDAGTPRLVLLLSPT